LVLALCVTVSVFALAGSAWTQPSPVVAPTVADDRAPVQDARVWEQTQLAHQLLQQHHAQTVDLRERTQQASLEHQERVRRELGDRAPTETVAPMATIAPIPPAD
jgi:hypothetical protein